MSTRRGFPEPLPPEKGQGGAFRTVLWETYPHPRGKNGRGHISHVRIQKKLRNFFKSGGLIKTAATYSPTVTQYHRRDKA
mgnify:CR=1 FL=1